MRWTTSSHSSNPQGCVQVRSPRRGVVEIGDTGSPEGPTITVALAEWERFLRRVAEDGTSAGRLPTVPLPTD